MSKVSVIIPVYNVEQYLEECLDSVLNQTYCDYEIIAVNDGSTDGSASILSDYAKKSKKIKVLTIKNQGQSVARNVGIDAAIGDYIIFLDSDDKITEETLEVCVIKLEEDRLDSIFFESEIIVDGVESNLEKQFNYQRPNVLFNKIVTGEEFFAESVNASKYIVQPCMYMFSRVSLGDLRFYPGILHEDNLFLTEFLLSGRLKRVGCLQRSLFLRRLRPGSIMTKKKSKAHLHGYLVVINELIKSKSKLIGSFTECAMKAFINQLLNEVFVLATQVYKLWIPVSVRKKMLYMVFASSDGKIMYKLIARSIMPHVYSYLQKHRKLSGF